MSTIEIMRSIHDGYTPIPNDLLRNPDVSHKAVRVYGFLRSHKSGWMLNVRAVATQLGMSKNTVSSAMQELETLGYVTREWQTTEGGVRNGMKYLIFDKPAGRAGVPKTGTRVSQFLGAQERGIPQIGTHKEEQSFKKNNPKEEQNPKTEFGAEFDAFWKSYPRKAGKQKAQTKFEEQISNGASPDDLVKASTNFRAETERQQTEMRYIPHPSTFLNQERWRDYLKAPAMSAADKRRATIEKLENLEL